jgi:3-oxoacyl-[acyl-carrier-protein] synthase II
MSQRTEVVITGLGVVSPIGVGNEAFWNSLDSGKSGIDWLPELPGHSPPFRYASRIKDFDAKQYVQPRKTIKVMCEAIQTAYAAATMAMQHGNLAKGVIEPDRFGVVLGSEVFFGDLNELVPVFRRSESNGGSEISRWGDAAFKELFPLWMLKYLPNMAACHISIAFDARGPNNSIVAGGTSSLAAVIEAADVIRRGHADAMLAGGSGSLSAFSCLPFRGWEHYSKWEGEPSGACRPFDARRSGIVPGEGAAVLLLESRDKAESRGAAILARVAGVGSAFEPPGGNWEPRSGNAIRQSITSALRTAGLSASDVGHVKAHGEGSLEQDRLEARAIRETIGDVPVTAPKSFFGDLGAGSGAVEIVASVLALHHGRIPQTLNYDQPDPACPVNVVRGQSQAAEKRTAIALNQAATGQALAVALVKD